MSKKEKGLDEKALMKTDQQGLDFHDMAVSKEEENVYDFHVSL